MWFVGTVTRVNILKGSGVTFLRARPNQILASLLSSISPEERDLFVEPLLYSSVNLGRLWKMHLCTSAGDDWLLALLQLTPVFPRVRIRRKNTA